MIQSVGSPLNFFNESFGSFTFGPCALLCSEWDWTGDDAGGGLERVPLSCGEVVLEGVVRLCIWDGDVGREFPASDWSNGLVFRWGCPPKHSRGESYPLNGH